MNKIFSGVPIHKYVYITGILAGKKVGDQYVLRRREYMLLPLYPLLFLWGVFLYWRTKRQEIQRLKGAQYQYKLAMVAIAKNEAPYIAEWLAFHKLQGVEVVFLYDNDSTDNMRAVLEPFIADGFVKYNVIHGAVKQFEAYTDAINQYGALCKYMAFIDCDEFLVPMAAKDRLLDLIESAFAKDVNVGGVGVNWCIYGSAGHEQKPDGLVIEHFNTHAKANFCGNASIKSIVKPSCVAYFEHAHYPQYKKGFYPINLQGKYCPSWWNDITAFDGMRVNHYICKSKEEYVARRKMGKADDGLVRPLKDFYDNDRNEEKDTIMVRYIDDVKHLMAEYK